MITTPTPEQILNTPMDEPNVSNVREYLVQLLYLLWDEGEAFSSKHPFGNSGWQYDVYAALVRAGHVVGKFDEDGYIEELDEVSAELAVLGAIKHISEVLDDHHS